mgnify:CR=1 FL=1
MLKKIAQPKSLPCIRHAQNDALKRINEKLIREFTLTRPSSDMLPAIERPASRKDQSLNHTLIVQPRAVRRLRHTVIAFRQEPSESVKTFLDRKQNSAFSTLNSTVPAITQNA